jgi:hypothetical protein
VNPCFSVLPGKFCQGLDRHLPGGCTDARWDFNLALQAKHGDTDLTVFGSESEHTNGRQDNSDRMCLVRLSYVAVGMSWVSGFFCR